MFSSSNFKVSGLKLRFLIHFSVDFWWGEGWGSGSSPDIQISSFPVPFVKEAVFPKGVLSHLSGGYGCGFVSGVRLIL